jgi:hypothetical protein
MCGAILLDESAQQFLVGSGKVIFVSHLHSRLSETEKQLKKSVNFQQTQERKLVKMKNIISA